MKNILYPYYTQKVPDRAIAIAAVSAPVLTPKDIVSIYNIGVASTFNVWTESAYIANPNSSPTFTAVNTYQPISISGSMSYIVSNQFFEITPLADSSNNPLFYYDIIPTGTINIVVQTLSGVTITSGWEVTTFPNVTSITQLGTGQLGIYHSLNDQPYLVSYILSSGQAVTRLLKTTLVLSPNLYSVGAGSYSIAATVLGLPDTEQYYLRFIANSGLQVLQPWTQLPNLPWHLRIRFNPQQPLPEYGQQLFNPTRPYRYASWVPGQVLTNSIIQFERPNIYTTATQLVDILVFDSNNNLKYAIDGTTIGSNSKRGSIYHWQQGLIYTDQSDWNSGRVVVAVNLEPTDIIYGFYYYSELDLIYTSLDVNPFSNPTIQNQVIDLYQRVGGTDPFHTFFYSYTGNSNDSSPGTGSITQIANVVTGISTGPNALTITDIRVRGGGLKPSYQNIEQASQCWDLGNWDGVPVPAAGTLIVEMPESVLQGSNNQATINRVTQQLAVGVIPTVFYYDSDGNEWR